MLNVIQVIRCFPYIDGAPGSVMVNNVQPTSVQVSWQAVEFANRYCVRLTQTMGEKQLGLCSPTHVHSVAVETSNLSTVVGQTDNNMLRPYTTYSITVVAMSGLWGSSEESKPITVTTNQTSEDDYCTFNSL